MIKLVLVDFDDTLCMTEEACFEMENVAAAKLGFSSMSRDAHLRNWGTPLEIAIAERFPGIDAKEFMKIAEKIHEQFIREKRIDIISKENLAFLDAVKKSEKSLAILTSRTLPEAKHLLEPDHPLQSRIAQFYHKDNTDFHKPDPRVFDKILKDFGVLPSESIYLGDSLGDGKSAKGAGLHFVAVLESGLKTQEDFNGIPVDFFATTLSEALDYISKN